MYADVEIITKNSYKFSIFTYKVPESLINQVVIGSIVNVNFRNKVYRAVVIDIKSNTIIQNIKNINNITNFVLSKDQLLYLKYISLSNYLNIGIVLNSNFDIHNFVKQKKIKKGVLHNLSFDQFNSMKFNKKNVFYVSSLKEANELNKILTKKIKIDFYQKFGGRNEILNITNNKKYTNIIVLNTNFEKIIIEEDTDYFFYNSNLNSYKLPFLNNMNIVESAYLKQLIFNGNFYFVNEFPNLEFFNNSFKFNNYVHFDIEYFVSSSIKNSFQLLKNKYKNTTLNAYSNEKLNVYRQVNQIEKLNDKSLNCLILINPTIVTNNILNSYKVIYLLRLLNYFKNNNLKIFVISNKNLDINKTLNSAKFNEWIINEQRTRQLYGPNLLMKIFSITSDSELTIQDSNHIIGPIKENNLYKYELQIKLNNNINYLEYRKIFANFQNYKIKRIRFI